METTELLKKVRKIEIKTRGLSNQIFSGEYHSAFKGRGMAFSEVREYQHGDDIRSIDWNVSARFNHTYVKIFEEERELTVILLADVSASGKFGTKKQFKKDLITELCAVLSFSAIQNNDKIGVIFFSDKIEKFIPPKKGKSHILRIIRELIEFKPDHTGTHIAGALQFFTNAIKKRSIAFLISDFMEGQQTENETGSKKSKALEDALKLAGRKHDLVAIRIYDEKEKKLPALGLMHVTDAETGKSIVVDSGHPHVTGWFEDSAKRKDEEIKRMFARSGVDTVSIRTDENYVQPLMNLFKRRGKKSSR